MSQFREVTGKLFNMVGGVALLTLVINGPTSGPLLKRLGLITPTGQALHLCSLFDLCVCLLIWPQHWTLLGPTTEMRKKVIFSTSGAWGIKSAWVHCSFACEYHCLLFVFWTNRSNIHAEIIRVDPILGLCRGCYIMRAPSWRWVSILESYAFLRNTHTTHTHFLTFLQIGMHWRLRLTALLGLLHIWWENCLIWNSGSSTKNITLA